MKDMGKQPRFVVCVNNDECEDLDVRKIYQVLPDQAAADDGLVRVVDESGEDYLYPASFFVLVEVPKAAERDVGDPATAENEIEIGAGKTVKSTFSLDDDVLRLRRQLVDDL